MKTDKQWFDEAIEEWQEFFENSSVGYSSNPHSITECYAYRKLLLMGYEALPLIRKLYDKNDSDNFTLSCIKGHGLPQLVADIVGKPFQVPKKIWGSIPRIEHYTKEWLDDNLEYLL